MGALRSLSSTFDTIMVFLCFWVLVGLDAAKPTQEDFFILLYRHTIWGSIEK